jgi:hypothetical protein
MPADQGIDPSEAAAFRRRLDYQGSTDLIPMAGPDAAADQGPAIKAVWEPGPKTPPDAAGHASRRRDRRSGHSGGSGHGHGGSPGGRSRTRRRRRGLIIGGVLTVALGATGYTELTGNGPTFTKGAATTILPAASSPTGASQSANSSLGTGISLTSGPSHSPTASHSPSATASASASPKQTKPAGGGSNPPGGQPTGTALPTQTSGLGGPGTSTPTPSPSQSPRSCFLIFCTG